jgi:hypothetical protein
VDFSAVVLTEAQQAFADELRALLDEHLAEDQRARRREQGGGFDERLYLALGSKGWLWPRWRREDGGAELDDVCVRILETELLKREAPVNGGAARLVWPVVEAFGAPGLRAELKPQVARGTARFTLGYTEPDGGSDIAGAKTQAVRDGDDWVINGQKTFTSSAQNANYTFLLTRTDPTLPKHHGLTMFLVPLDSAGIERQALPTIGGVDNTVYYKDVRVADRYRIGEVNNGWSVLRRPLDAEHNLGGQASKLADVSGGVHHMRYLEESVEAAIRWARDARGRDESAMIGDTVFLAGIGRILAEAEAGFVTPGPKGRVKGSDVARLGCEQLIDLIGADAALPYGADGAIGDGIIAFAHRQAQETALAGGSVEVTRNIIAQHDLGLPRLDYPGRKAFTPLSPSADSRGGADKRRYVRPIRPPRPAAGRGDAVPSPSRHDPGPRPAAHPSGWVRRRMPGLVDGKLRAVWQADGRDEPPALIGDVPGHLGALALQLGEGGLNVVTHEVKLVTACTIGWMNGKLGRGESENEPASACVDRRQARHIREECAELLSFGGEHNRMYSGDHAAILAARAVAAPWRTRFAAGRSPEGSCPSGGHR